MNELGGRDAALFLVAIPILGGCVIGLAGWLARSIPVVKRGHSEYGYLVHHYNFALLALAMFLLCTLMTWFGSEQLRGVVNWDLANMKKFRAMILDKIPQSSQQERLMWKVMKELS